MTGTLTEKTSIRMAEKYIVAPDDGEQVTYADGHLQVPDHPIVCYIEGDGTGPDIWHACQRVLDAAVAHAYAGTRTIAWMEVFAGERANDVWGDAIWLPEETLAAIREFRVAIKGPLSTPVGGGIRSINVALRQRLDLYACVRPVRYFTGVPSPVRRPELVDMVVFRENTEDIYAGIEWMAGTREARQMVDFLQTTMGTNQIRFPDTSSIGIKPISQEGTQRLVKAAIQYALDNGRRNLTLVHKGNIMKFTEGGFRQWGYETAQAEFGAQELDGGPWMQLKGGLIVKDVIADAFLQQILTRPDEYDVIATMNLNGDYVSDALAAQIGGIGIAPGANINYEAGCAIFEATHGTAPKYAGLDQVNPSSMILSGEMMLRYLGWHEAADTLIAAMGRTFAQKMVTYDLHRLMEGATKVKCSEFAAAVVKNM